MRMPVFTDSKPQADNQTAIKMASACPSPLLKLFGVDRPGPGHSLQHIRDKIYSHAWSRTRRDDHKLDFVISETGINRNVPERLIFGEDPHSALRAPRTPPPPCNLLLVNKQVSKDFARYIYSVNDLEVDVDLKPVHTDEGQAALDKINTLLRNSNMKRYTRNIRVRIHFPAKYPAANLPDFNQSALNNISFALDDFQHLEHLAIRMVPGQGAPLDYELRLAAFPFYPMGLTNWSIRMLNTETFPYAWDLLDTQNVGLLNQAYHTYQQTGSLTAPIMPAQFNSANSDASHKDIRQPSHSFRQPTNGSLKRRIRKKKAIKADVAIIETTVETTSSTMKQAVNTTTSSNVQPPGLGVTIIHPTRASTEHVVLDLEMDRIQPTAAKTGTEESPNSKDAFSSASFLQQARPISASSPHLSPAQESQVLHMPDSIGSLISCPTKFTTGKCVSDRDVSDPAEQPKPSSPAPSSVTLAPTDDDAAVQHVDHVTGAIGDADVDSTQLQPAKRKRRSKKGKNTKTKSETLHSVDLHHDISPGAIVETETEMKGSHQEQTEPSNEVARRLEEASDESLPSDLNRFHLTQGRWDPISDSHAMFTSNTGFITLYARNPRIERYLRQQERMLAARAEAEERQKQAKGRNQARKARKLLLRRDHIAADSPLLRAVVRPRGYVKKSNKPRSQSPSQEAAEPIVEVQEEYRRAEGETEKIQEMIWKCERGLQRAVELQDGEKRKAENQSGPENSNQDHRFAFDTGISDSDVDSIDSLFQERPESNDAEDSGEGQDEANTVILVAKVKRDTRPHTLSLRIQRKDSESDKFEATGPSMSEQGQQSTENASEVSSKSLIEEDTVAKLGSPAFPVFVPPAEQDDVGHDEQSGHEKGALCGDSLSKGIADNEQTTRNEMDSSESKLGKDVYSEYGLHQQPDLQPGNVGNDFVRLVSPASLWIPSNALSTQRIVDEDLPECAQSSAEISQSGATQWALQNVQRFPESDESASGVGGHPMTDAYHPLPQDHQRVLGGNQHGHWSRQRGRHSCRGRGRYHGINCGDRTYSMGPDVGKVENPWATAVQESDRELVAQSVER